MSRNSLAVLVAFTGIGILVTLIPGLVPVGLGMGFAYSFFLAGLVWLAVSYFSGGFVSTYVAPPPPGGIGGRGGLLLYATPSRVSNLPLTADRPEVSTDLRNKMADQTSPMVLAFLKALAFFGLTAVFYSAPLVGVVMLVGVFALFAILFIRSRPRGSTGGNVA